MSGSAEQRLVMMPQPDLLACFRRVGERMRPLRDLLGEEEVFFAFADYKERGRYFTSTRILALYILNPDAIKFSSER